MHLMIVVCMFGRDWQHVASSRQLPIHVREFEALGIRCHRLIVYDNSPEAHDLGDSFSPGSMPKIDYVHDPANGGTAAAYEFATKAASARHADWLLLLDHDTILPSDFFARWVAAIHMAPDEVVDAFVPWVTHEGVVVSPATVTGIGSIRPLSRTAAPKPETAIASGSIFRVESLRAVMPLPHGLWLDFVDHWLFAEIRARRGVVRVFDAEVDHDLSIARPASLSRRRLLSVLEGEARFVRSLEWPARYVHPIRLMHRLARYLVIRPRLAAWMAAWIFSRRSLAR